MNYPFDLACPIHRIRTMIISDEELARWTRCPACGSEMLPADEVTAIIIKEYQEAHK